MNHIATVGLTQCVQEQLLEYMPSLPNCIEISSVEVGERPVSDSDILLEVDIISQGDFVMFGATDNPVTLFRTPSVDDKG